VERTHNSADDSDGDLVARGDGACPDASVAQFELCDALESNIARGRHTRVRPQAVGERVFRFVVTRTVIPNFFEAFAQELPLP